MHVDALKSDTNDIPKTIFILDDEVDDGFAVKDHHKRSIYKSTNSIQMMDF